MFCASRSATIGSASPTDDAMLCCVKDFWITNSSYGEIGRDEDVQKLVPDSTLYVLSMASSTPRRVSTKP